MLFRGNFPQFPRVWKKGVLKMKRVWGLGFGSGFHKGGGWISIGGEGFSAFGGLNEGSAGWLPHQRPCKYPYPQSPDGDSFLPEGRSLFGGRWLSWETNRNGNPPNQHKTPCSGGKRNGAQPRCSPHCDGSGRRQIPVPFWAAGRRAHVQWPTNSKTANSWRRTADCARPPNKMGIKRDLTKGSVSPFSAYSFSKE